MIRFFTTAFISFVIFSCSQELENNTSAHSIICTADEPITLGDPPFFICGDYHFDNAHLASEEIAFSGKKSLRLTKEEKRGMTVVLKGPEAGATYMVSAKLHGQDGQIVMHYKLNDKDSYVTGGSITNRINDDWRELTEQFQLPPIARIEKVRFYLQNPGEAPIFLDDFTITKTDGITYPEIKDMTSLTLTVEPEQLSTLKTYRDLAFERGVLDKESKQFVKSKIRLDSNEIDGKIRLKGEWLDHLEGDKWSFRLKSKEDILPTISEFSIHSPVARNFLKEYLAHKVFKDEGLLTSQYGFLNVNLNGKSLGVYAYEEYFDLAYGARNGRKRGLMIRWDEEGFWALQKIRLSGNDSIDDHPKFDAAYISTFEKSKVLKDPILKDYYNKASQILYDWRDNKIGIEDAFCVDQLAKYYALADVFGTYHGAVWHNIRYFYNADSAKLEPVLFDGYTDGDKGVYVWFGREFIGDIKNVSKRPHEESYQLNKMYDSDVFRQKYQKYAYKYASKEYQDQIIERYNSEIDSLEKQIRIEFPDYKYDDKFLMERAQKLNEVLTRNQEQYKKFTAYPIYPYVLPCNYELVPNLSIQVYTQDQNEFQRKILIENNHCQALEVLINDNWESIETGKNDRLEAIIPRNIKSLPVRLKGAVEQMETKILPFKR